MLIFYKKRQFFERMIIVDEYDNSVFYQPVQKGVALTVGYLIGTRMDFLVENNPGYKDLFERLSQDKEAVILRSLCNIRTNLMLNYTNTERNIVFNLQNLDRQEIYKEDVRTLAKNDINIIKVNYKVNRYLVDINSLISQHILNVKDLFPEWVKWDYIKSLFLMPKGQSEEAIKAESKKFIQSRLLYPFTRYINWHPVEEGNILLNDEKFLKILYRQFKDEFSDISKVKDASESVKTNIYDFIKNNKSTVIVVDCENSDAYKLASVLKQLDQNEIERIHKIMLYDDIHTTRAWTFLNKITNIPVEHILVDRIKENKSLVDMKMCAGVSASYYRDNISSFILCSSDSDFWGLISSLPEAKFLVMIEYSKCGPDIKNALIENGTYYCSIDDFCTGNIKNFKMAILHNELESRVKDIVEIDTKALLDDIFTTLRMEISDAEKQNFYKKYIQSMALHIDRDGIMKIKIQD